MFLARSRLLSICPGVSTNHAIRHSFPRCLSQTARRNTDYTSKYAQKLEKRAQEEGTSIDGLRARVKEQESERSRQRLAAAAEAATKSSADVTASVASDAASTAKGDLPPGASVRKDSSPVKSLSSYLNLDRLLAAPHTSAQVSALWTTYHASRSRGTGRGFICASLPRSTYETMLSVAQKYPAFVVPVPRVPNADTSDAESAEQKSFEFYFMQWAFYEAPPVPAPGQTGGFPFADPKPAPSAPPNTASNPRTATILFTPLLEYKLRQTFATPYLILTFYPDLAGSHDVVLMRGEITPRANSTPDEADFLLSQQDAQLLALDVQKFFLWTGGAGGKEREALLKTFHEQPENFKWEDLLKHGEVVV